MLRRTSGADQPSGSTLSVFVDCTSQLAYWRQQLNTAPPRLELPADRGRLGGSGPSGASQSVPPGRANRSLRQRRGVAGGETPASRARAPAIGCRDRYLLTLRRFGLLAPSCKGRIARAKMTARRFCFTSEDKLTTLWRTYNNSTGRASKHRPIISQLNVTLTSCLFESGLLAFLPSSPSGRES